MSFDWKEESKERYFRKAEQQVETAGFGDILQIEKGSFATVKGRVKVFFKPIERAGNTRQWKKAKKTLKNVVECPAMRDTCGKEMKTIFIHAYMILEMEEQDR